MKRASISRIILLPLGVAPLGFQLFGTRARMASRKITNARCTVCAHPERHRIEMLRLAGSTIAVICEKFPELGRMSVHRHMLAHVDAEMKAEMVADVPLAELAERAVKEGGSLLDHFEVLRFTVEGQLRRAAAISDYGSVSSLTKRALEINQAIGRLSGDLLNSAPVRNYVQNNIHFGDSTMSRLERVILDRLGPWPDAMAAMLAGLSSLDESQTPLIDVTPHGGSHAV